MLLFITCLVSSLIVSIGGQYGQPLVYGKGQFSYECRQTDVDVIAFPNNQDYEVLSGKSFSYNCDFFVDTRECAHNRQSSGCEGVQITWTIPEQLNKLENAKGITRKSENLVIEHMDGYDTYRASLQLKSVGSIHEGRYGWKFGLRFEMRTVMEGSFKITTIDMLELGEPCKYNDMCQSNKCLESQCVTDEPEPFPWLIVGLVTTIVILMTAIAVLAIIYVKNKQRKYLSVRRF